MGFTLFAVSLRLVMSKWFLITVLAYAGCYDEPSNVEVEAPLNVEIAIDTTRSYLEEIHGPLPDVDVPIYWVEGPCIKGTDFDDTHDCLIGYFHSALGIYVVKKNSIAASALAHELMHFYQHAIGEWTIGHSNRPMWWDHVKPISKQIWSWECYTKWIDSVCDEQKANNWEKVY